MGDELRVGVETPRTSAPKKRFVGLDELTARPGRDAKQHFIGALRDRWPDADNANGVEGFWIGTALISALVAALIGMPTGILLDVASVTARASWPDSVPWWTAAAITAIAIGVPVVRWARNMLRRDFTGRGGWNHWFRLTRVAARNDLAYLPDHTGYSSPGLVLAELRPGEYRDVFTDGGTPMLQFGNFMPSADRFRATGWGFLIVELDRPVGRLLFTPRHGKVRVSRTTFHPVALPSDLTRRGAMYTSTKSSYPLEVISRELILAVGRLVPGAYIEATGRKLVITAPRAWVFDRARTWADIESLVNAVAIRATEASATHSAGALATVSGPTAAGRIAPGFVTPAPRPRMRLSLLAFLPLGVFVLFTIARVLVEAHPSCGC